MSIWHLGTPSLRSGSSALRYTFWNSYKVGYHAAQQTGPVHRVALDKRWNEREQTGIWVSVTCPVSVCSKATVRRHHGRRMRAAIEAAFHERGLDKHGKGMDDQIPSLQGTLHLLAQPSIIQATFPRLRSECIQMVSKVVETGLQGKDWNSRKRLPAQRSNYNKPKNQSQTPSPGQELSSAYRILNRGTSNNLTKNKEARIKRSAKSST